MSVAMTQTRFLSIGSPGNPVKLRDGGVLPGIRVAYETWGKLNKRRDNAILVFHALSGSQHAAGLNEGFPEAGGRWQKEMREGWWDLMTGPGKALDTEKFFVICFNYLGGCYGSTGPADEDPGTGDPYGSTFPHLRVGDQTDIAAGLLDSLGIARLHALAGPSVGGLCALTFAAEHPARVARVVLIATGFKTTVLNRLILFEQIMAIENDPHFNGGDYYGGKKPDYGLALARMISHKTFVHLDMIERRARRDVVQPEDSLSWYRVRDQFQSYMLHQGKKFVERFDANTYLRIADMWSRYNAVAESGADSPGDLLAKCREEGQKFLVFSIDSDFCFYPEEQSVLYRCLLDTGIEAMHITVHSDKGHDSFLLEPALYTPHIRQLLGE